MLPIEALQFSSEILKFTFDYLLNLKFDEKGNYTQSSILFNVPKKINEIFDETKNNPKKLMLKQSVKVLNLSTRPSRCLAEASIKTIGDLLKRSSADIRGLKSAGVKSVKEIKTKLKEVLNLKLK